MAIYYFYMPITIYIYMYMYPQPKTKTPRQIMNLSSLFFTLTLVCFFTLTNALDPQCDTLDHDSTLKIIHISSPCSPFKSTTDSLSWEDSVLQIESKDRARFQYLAGLVVSKKSIVPIASGRQIIQSPTYIVKAKIGTPPQTMLMAMDTSSDVAWIPCGGCVGCASPTLFAPSSSATFKNVSCQSLQCKQVPNPTCAGSACAFNLTYGSSSIAANVSQDTLSLATDIVPDYTFGCIEKATGSSLPVQGLLGLGRGALSLMSQTQNLYQSTFSYCLPSFKSPNFSGSLRLGPIGQPPKMKYTPLLKNPRRSSLYYVNLIAIKVGRRTLDIPLSLLAFNPITGAGTIFDSGTVFTRLVDPVYTAVRNEFRRRVGRNITVTSLGGFDTCYTIPLATPPTMTFMFTGMNVTFPPENFLIHSTAGSKTCLAMAPTPLNVNSVLNVIANMQQQNHRILFDVPNSRLGFARETCS